MPKLAASKKGLSKFLLLLFSEKANLTCKTASLIDYTLTTSSQKVSQCGAIEFSINDHNLVYCTKNTLPLSSINTMTHLLGLGEQVASHTLQI